MKMTTFYIIIFINHIDCRLDSPFKTMFVFAAIEIVHSSLIEMVNIVWCIGHTLTLEDIP